MVVMVTLVDAAKETRTVSQSDADVSVGYGVRPRTEEAAFPSRPLTNHIGVLLSGGDVSQAPLPLPETTGRRGGVEGVGCSSVTTTTPF